MRSTTIILVFLFCLMPLIAQSVDANLQSELAALHGKWFRAFFSGDGDTMAQIQMDNPILVMPTGAIWTKMKARRGEQQENAQTDLTLTDVSVQRFGDTAIFIGILTSKSPKENSKNATTVVFVQSSGKWKIASVQWTPVSAGH